MKTEKRKMKGSVLLTVVSVMGLLIIFLSGTLVLATAANRRAHRSYSTSQAELTAKAAIESFTAAMADNEKIAAAVQNLDKTYHPTVSINDPSLGHIGYYDGSTFIENAITIEPLTTSGKFVHGKFDLQNPGAEVWQEASQVKITVTARVGKEEKTVSALLNKVGMSTNVPSDDIGLYAGGEASVDATAGKIYSPFAEGLTTNGGFTCEVQNDTEFFSPVIFFNSNAKMNTGNIIHVRQPGQSTVIRGDLNIRNPFSIKLEYSMNNDYTQKDIPYLFVEGSINDIQGGGHADGARLNVEAGTNSPYNIFAGKMDWTAQFSIPGDVYLMDAGSTSVLGDASHTGDLYKWADSVYNKTQSMNYSEGASLYSKGNIEIGKVHFRGDVRVEGNAKFLTSGAKIDGDLIVGGTITGIDNVTVDGNIYNDTLTGGATLNTNYQKIYGTYVPGGIGSQYNKVENIKVSNYAYPNISVFESSVETWTLAMSYMRTSPDGTKVHEVPTADVESHLDADGNPPKFVWVQGEWNWWFDGSVPDWAAGNVEKWELSAGYNYNTNEPTYVSPDGSQTKTVNTGSIGGSVLDYIMVDGSGNIINNYDVSEGLTYYPVDENGNEVPGADPVADAESFFRADVNGNVTDVRVPAGETWTYYLADVNGNAAIDDAGNNIVIDAATTPIEDLEYTYYDMLDPSGTPTQIAFASIPVTTGYYEFSIPDPSDPSKNYTSTQSSVYVDASNNIVSEAEALASPGSRKVEKVAAWQSKSGDQIYPEKMEKDIIYGSVVGGSFHKSTDSNQYILTLDDMRNKISYRENAMGDFEFDSTKYPTTEPAGVDKAYTDPSVQTNGVITKSCVISGNLEKKNIVIRPENEIWVILDNVTMNNGGKIVVDSNAGGDCKFFIKGTLRLKSSASIYSTLCMKNGDDIRYNSSLHIYYYGAPDSKIVSENNSVITGYGRCPKTALELYQGKGPITIDYLDEQGVSNSVQPAWIGNVIYDGSKSANNLTFALVKEGGGGNTGTIKTGIGYFEYEYYSSN
jgi:hypothetical protein